MKKKKYVKAKIEIIELDVEDIVATSPGDDTETERIKNGW